MLFALKRLSEVKPGETAVVDSFTDEVMKLKLLEMGCLPGEEVTVDRIAPMGDPIAILLDDSTISLRRDEAENVLVRAGSSRIEKVGDRKSA